MVHMLTVWYTEKANIAYYTAKKWLVSNGNVCYTQNVIMHDLCIKWEEFL